MSKDHVLEREPDCRIFYEAFGAGPAVLFVTGLNGVASHWQPQITALSSSHRVIAFDQRGCGRSTASTAPCTIEQVAEDALAILDDLEIDSAHIVGHSLGGAVGQYIAALKPERVERLVLLSSWLHADLYFKKVMSLRRELLRAVGAAAYVEAGSAFLYPPAWLTEHEPALRETESKIEAAFPPPQVVLERIDAVLAFDGRPFPTIDAQALVMVAADDILTPPYLSRQLSDRIPRSTLRILDTGAHMFTQVAAAPVNAHLVSFLGS